MPPTDGLSREELVALVRSQAEHITRLESKIAELERKLGRNSGNSSMPPSSDELPGRTAPNRATRRKGVAGRPKGKQRGAPGSGLAWRLNPDSQQPHYPAGSCACGADLGQATDLGVDRSQQVHDVPTITVRVVQHDLHRVGCGCGRQYVAAGPGSGPVSYGPNLQAFAVYLLVYQHVPVARCAQLIADLTGATPSTGFVHGMLTRAAGTVTGVVATIKTLITRAPVVGFDETTLRVGPAGRKKYVLSAVTETLTALHLGGRDLASFKDFGILPAFTGIAVHDRYAAYDHPGFTMAGHQLCTAHLLRDLADAAESYPDQHWPAQTDRALRDLISGWHHARTAGQREIPAAVCGPPITTLRHGILVGLSQIPRTPGPANTKQPPARMLLECLHHRQTDITRFAFDTRIWPTNNISERSLRPEKTQQKISGRLQSEPITRHRLTLRSYLSSAAKNQINMMTALRDALTGHPWTPTSPTPT